jgi:hypothetical protein
MDTSHRIARAITEKSMACSKSIVYASTQKQYLITLTKDTVIDCYEVHLFMHYTHGGF